MLEQGLSWLLPVNVLATKIKKTLTIKTVQQGLSSASIRKGGIALKQAPLEACFQVIILVT